MSSTTEPNLIFGFLMFLASAVSGWFVQDSWFTGRGISAWGLEVTRRNWPVLYWFDLVVYGLLTVFSSFMAGTIALDHLFAR